MLVPLLLSMRVENGGEEGRRGSKALTRGAAGICVTRAILRLFVRLAPLHPSITQLDGCFPKNAPSLRASLSHQILVGSGRGLAGQPQCLHHLEHLWVDGI